jgi:hypothetical protein
MRICGQRALRRVIPICFAFIFAASAPAQQTPKARVAVARTIVLPSKAVAGAPATLAVLDAGGRLLPNAVVEISGGQRVTTDATGRALFTAPGQPGTMTARISGKDITASAAVAASADSQPRASAETLSPEPRIISYPHIVAIHDRFTIEGAGFRGAADSNRVFLAGQVCLVLASSPVSLVILPGPHTPVRATSLHVSVEERDTGPTSISAVLLDFSGPVEGSSVGAQAKLTVRVHGSTEPLAVEIRNGSPQIIQFPDGNVQRLTTSGGNQNIAQVDMKFLASGDYTVTAKLVPADSGPLNLETVRQKLIAARAYATQSWMPRLDRLLSQIDKAPRDIAAIRAEFKAMLDEKPAGQFGSLLESAWRDIPNMN